LTLNYLWTDAGRSEKPGINYHERDTRVCQRRETHAEMNVFTEEVHDLPVHHTFHDLHHNAGKAYESVVLGAMLASLLGTGVTLALVQSDGNCPVLSDSIIEHLRFEVRLA